ncbi:ABC transporter ATP-binding protein [Robiginitalea sp. IMCC43444]|uniref:ABC transporter ATP-binding protein n=1 Tax=Robiginitalea sp. IMCC43444 TaxID=3459121 RepID=UPI004042D3F8
MSVSQSENELEVSELSIGYKSRLDPLVLASGIHFSLPSGSLTAVVGANGIGKSTLLRCLCGMQPPLKGNILLRGIGMDQLKPEKRAQLLSVVLTDPPASGNLTVSELVRLGRYPYTNWLGTLRREDHKHIEGALEQMELDHIAKQPCHTLSDGQLQRVLIARALAQDTPLMVLDEPTTHLDLYHKVKILKLLGEIAHNRDKTILFSTHEIDLAIQLCDYMLILHQGQAFFGQPCQLIETGRFEQLFPEQTIRFDRASGSFRVNKK